MSIQKCLSIHFQYWGFARFVLPSEPKSLSRSHSLLHSSSHCADYDMDVLMLHNKCHLVCIMVWSLSQTKPFVYGEWLPIMPNPAKIQYFGQ